jgi:hypothetical protein
VTEARDPGTLRQPSRLSLLVARGHGCTAVQERSSTTTPGVGRGSRGLDMRDPVTCADGHSGASTQASTTDSEFKF